MKVGLGGNHWLSKLRVDASNMIAVLVWALVGVQNFSDKVEVERTKLTTIKFKFSEKHNIHICREMKSLLYIQVRSNVAPPSLKSLRRLIRDTLISTFVTKTLNERKNNIGILSKKHSSI